MFEAALLEPTSGSSVDHYRCGRKVLGLILRFRSLFMQGCLNAAVTVPWKIESRVRERNALEANVFNRLSALASNNEQLVEPRCDELSGFDFFAIPRNIFQLALRLV